MGYVIEQKQLDLLLQSWQSEYLIFAPKRFTGGGRFSDTDMHPLRRNNRADEIVFDEKSQYSFKEALVPVSETLFFFTEDQTREAKPGRKEQSSFMRSCDINALRSGWMKCICTTGLPTTTTARLRDNIKIVLMGCSHSFESCFCVSMGTSQTDNYDMSIDRLADGSFAVDCKDTGISELLRDWDVRSRRSSRPLFLKTV
jgi:anaerobic sulfite reductase subunit A